MEIRTAPFYLRRYGIRKHNLYFTFGLKFTFSYNSLVYPPKLTIKIPWYIITFFARGEEIIRKGVRLYDHFLEKDLLVSGGVS